MHYRLITNYPIRTEQIFDLRMCEDFQSYNKRFAFIISHFFHLCNMLKSKKSTTHSYFYGNKAILCTQQARQTDSYRYFGARFRICTIAKFTAQIRKAPCKNLHGAFIYKSNQTCSSICANIGRAVQRQGCRIARFPRAPHDPLSSRTQPYAPQAGSAAYPTSRD